MRKTFAANGITIGTLLGLFAGLLVISKDGGLPLGIIVGLVVGIVTGALAWFIIRWLENLVYNGVDAGVEAAKNAYEKRKQEKALNNQNENKAPDNDEK